MLVLQSSVPSWDRLKSDLSNLPLSGLVLLTLPQGELPAQARTFLSPSERRAARAYTREHLAGQYLWRRAVLRWILGQVLNQAPSEVDLALGPLGKPENPQLCFNLSFSGSQVAYIWGPRDKAVGVDIEVPRPGDFDGPEGPKADSFRAVVQQFFSPEERDWLGEEEVLGNWRAWVDGFYTLWCRKEALVKAAGVSIGSHGDICPVLGPGPGEIPVEWEGKRWRLLDLGVSGLYGARAFQI